jgi:4-carboxymuconolactone decarboxylase
MIPRPTRPRLSPLAAGELDDAQRSLLAMAADGPPAGNLFHTLVRHPGLLRKWIPYSGKLLVGGKLPGRDREILILRTGFHCRARYEWAQHVVIGRSVGLQDADFDLIASDEPAGSADPWDLLLIRAADELHRDACLGEDTWAELATRYDERQLIEVPMVVGGYHQVSFVLNSLGIPVDDDIPDTAPWLR